LFGLGLLLKDLNLLLLHLDFIVQLSLLLSRQGFILLVGHFELLNPSVELIDLFEDLLGLLLLMRLRLVQLGYFIDEAFVLCLDLVYSSQVLMIDGDCRSIVLVT